MASAKGGNTTTGWEFCCIRTPYRCPWFAFLGVEVETGRRSGKAGERRKTGYVYRSPLISNGNLWVPQLDETRDDEGQKE